MVEFITAVNKLLNDFIWGVPAMTCIIGVGLYLAIRTGFLHIRKFGYAMKNTIGRIFDKTTAAEGSLTPFKSESVFIDIRMIQIGQTTNIFHMDKLENIVYTHSQLHIWCIRVHNIGI